jgi:hypothetical protein
MGLLGTDIVLLFVYARLPIKKRQRLDDIRATFSKLRISGRWMTFLG